MSSVEQILQQADWKRTGTGITLLVLIAFSSPLFSLTLAPVYGTAPAHIFHGYGVGIAAGLGWFFKDHIHRLLNGRVVYLLPALAFWVPTIQYLLSQQSLALGNPIGPLLTDILAFYPLVLLTVACAIKLLQMGLHLTQHGDLVAEHVPLLSSYAIYAIGENIGKLIMSRCLGSAFFFSRVGLQLFIAALYSAAIPSKLLLLALPSIFVSFTSNPHLQTGRATTVLNSALQDEGYALVARKDSLTGYISVLDNLEDGFRVMRCDHSLLGGQWIKEHRTYKPTLKDPIYAVFTMLEAVRLVETDHSEPRVDANSKALVIGLGVGTTPSAFITHGIETTIVEIDPVVYKFATEYFNLPSNHIAAIEDATAFVKRSQESANPVQYDYIVHDVFTGGAEPVELFTLEFLQGLNALLKPDGAIAINYAGDISLYPAALTVRTILAVFPSCRIFREEVAAEDNVEFTNMVVFCKKSSATPLRFRDPVPADFLKSQFRESYLVPKHEIDPARFRAVEKGGRSVLVAKEAGLLDKYQDRGALEHWQIMRHVIPDAVWENW
ncbi:S-adenosyl-L-methionine-dependent methyltransferase [Aspergillus ambiguus]|uniref:spermidine synthase n=1 Tax=Aspergillus ambiguus TaxID=176160 RepID=UPI003CCD6F7B